MRQSRLCRSVWGIPVLLMLAGCDPKIFAFDIQPRRVCAGDSVQISWKVRGTARVEAVRHTGDSLDTIRYTLTAESHGKSVSRYLDVATFSPGAPAAVALDAFMLGRDSLVARDTIPAAPWRDLIRVGDITTDSERRVLVRHAGVDGLVGPGREANPAWRDKLVSGAWEIRSGLLRGEVPGSRTRPPPSRLYITLSLACDARGTGP
jgi:hypothetical protein